MAPKINKLAPIQIVAPKINKMAPKINKMAPIQTWHQKLIKWHQFKTWLYRPFSVILIQRYLMNPLLTAQGSGPEKKLLFFWILSIMGRNILSVTSPFNTPPPSSRRQSYASNFLINIAQNNLPQTIYELSPNYVIINNVAFDTIAP